MEDLIVGEVLQVLDQLYEGENQRRSRMERWLKTHQNAVIPKIFGIYRRRQRQWLEMNQNQARLELCREGLKLGHYERTIQILQSRIDELERRIPEAGEGDEELWLSPHQGLARQYQNIQERLQYLVRELSLRIDQ